MLWSDSEGASEVGGCETGVPFGVSDAEMLCEPEKKQSIILLSTERWLIWLIRETKVKKILAQVSNPKP